MSQFQDIVLTGCFLLKLIPQAKPQKTEELKASGICPKILKQLKLKSTYCSMNSGTTWGPAGDQNLPSWLLSCLHGYWGQCY